MISENDIKQKFAEVKGKRKANREKLISEISGLFLDKCRQDKVFTFPRSTLNFLADDLDLKERQKRKIVQDVLNLMKSKKKIKEDIKVTAIYSYRNKSLFSFDSGSYNLMMAKNGYKRTLSKWENKNGYPQKKKIAVLEMGNRIPQDCEEWNDSEVKSYKAQQNQAVYSNGNLSVVRDFCFYSEKKIYSIL